MRRHYVVIEWETRDELEGMTKEQTRRLMALVKTLPGTAVASYPTTTRKLGPIAWYGILRAIRTLRRREAERGGTAPWVNTEDLA